MKVALVDDWVIPSLIYRDQTWCVIVLFWGAHIRLLTRCKFCFTFGLFAI